MQPLISRTKDMSEDEVDAVNRESPEAHDT